MAGRLTPASVAHVLHGLLDDEPIVVNEAISTAPVVWKHLPRQHGRNALRQSRHLARLVGRRSARHQARQPGDRTVVSIVGDGTFFFSAPSSTYWIAEHYRLPVLTVVLDNGGWNATKRNLEWCTPTARAATTDRLWVNLRQSSDFGGIAAAAGNAWGTIVSDFDRLEDALRQGLEKIAAGTPAVVTVRLAAISAQPEEAAGPPPPPQKGTPRDRHRPSVPEDRHRGGGAPPELLARYRAS